VRFVSSLVVICLVFSLGACTRDVVDKRIVKIGGESFELRTLRVGTSAGFVTRYEIFDVDDDDDPLASCTDLNECMAEIEERQKRNDPVPELLRRPSEPSLPGSTPTLTSDMPNDPTVRQGE
jgi:hypothetical protein